MNEQTDNVVPARPDPLRSLIATWRDQAEAALLRADANRSNLVVAAMARREAYLITTRADDLEAVLSSGVLRRQEPQEQGDTRMDSPIHGVATDVATAPTARPSTYVHGYDAAFWHESYTLLRDAVIEHLGDCVHDDDVAEEAIMIEGITLAGVRLKLLLEALEAIDNITQFAAGDHFEIPADEWREAMALVRAALLKAEGR